MIYDFPIGYQPNLFAFEKIFKGKYLVLMGLSFRDCIQGEIFRREINTLRIKLIFFIIFKIAAKNVLKVVILYQQYQKKIFAMDAYRSLFVLEAKLSF